MDESGEEADVEPGIFCPSVQNSDEVPKPNGRSSSEKAAHAVDDELIIYQMSALMKTGQLGETTALAAAEVSTSLLAPRCCSAPPERASSCAQTRHDYTLVKITAAPFHLCQYCCWMDGAQTENIGGRRWDTCAAQSGAPPVMLQMYKHSFISTSAVC